MKATTLRIKLVEILQNAKTPLSYDEILESLDANKTTFYRSMEIFEKENLVIKTENNHKSYYELANEAKAYFIWDVCHKMTNIDRPHLSIAKNIKIAVRKGVCDECGHE
ncbi:transcriptional repressor [Campylobacter concisus]|uniref:transcriptional repressor n=1 Tax=Campylobacter concisus TaxID=199 RepID=UPI000CD8E408|nr:transcriptional repressor [Campylobacter concisus]